MHGWRLPELQLQFYASLTRRIEESALEADLIDFKLRAPSDPGDRFVHVGAEWQPRSEYVKRLDLNINFARRRPVLRPREFGLSIWGRIWPTRLRVPAERNYDALRLPGIGAAWNARRDVGLEAFLAEENTRILDMMLTLDGWDGDPGPLEIITSGGT